MKSDMDDYLSTFCTWYGKYHTASSMSYYIHATNNVDLYWKFLHTEMLRCKVIKCLNIWYIDGYWMYSSLFYWQLFQSHGPPMSKYCIDYKTSLVRVIQTSSIGYELSIIVVYVSYSISLWLTLIIVKKSKYYIDFILGIYIAYSFMDVIYAGLCCFVP